MKAGSVVPQGAVGVRAASSLLRLLAGAIDLVIPAGLTVVVCVTAGFPDVVAMPPRYWNYLDYMVDVFNSQPAVVIMPAAIFCGMYLVTTTVCTAIFGNTPISRLFGVRARNMAGKGVGWFRAFLWSLFGLVFSLIAFAGPLWTIVDPKRRMLHDILARVMVVSGRLRPGGEGADSEGAAVADVPWHEDGGNW